MPLTQTCLASENPYERKGGLMCLAVLAEGCADHIRTKYVQLTRGKFPIYFFKNVFVFHDSTSIFFVNGGLLAD